MKKNSGQINLQLHANHEGSYSAHGQSQKQINSQKPPMMKGGPNKGKLQDLNISMDPGINNYTSGGMPLNLNESSHQNLYMQGYDPQKQNLINTLQANPNVQSAVESVKQKFSQESKHQRSASHAVDGPLTADRQKHSKKNSVQFSNQRDMKYLMGLQKNLVKTMSQGQGQLSQAQLQQMAQIQYQQQQHNDSYNQEYQGTTVGQIIRANDTDRMSEKKANRPALKQQKFQPQVAGQIQMQLVNNAAKKQYETARHNSISYLQNQQNQSYAAQNIAQNQSYYQQSHSKERFQGTQKIGKKSTNIQGKGGSIILPSSSGLKQVPQLKQQMQKGYHTIYGKNLQQNPLNHSIQSQRQFVPPTHQRMNSMDDLTSLRDNMQRGFNSASNAAMNQQQNIVAIYQQQNVKYKGKQGNSNRKVVPILQQQQQQVSQAIGYHKRTKSHVQQISRDADQNYLIQSAQQNQNMDDSYHLKKNNISDTGTNYLNNVKIVNEDLDPQFNETADSLVMSHKRQKSQQHIPKMQTNHSGQSSYNQTLTQGYFSQAQIKQDPNMGKVGSMKHSLQNSVSMPGHNQQHLQNQHHVRQGSIGVDLTNQNKKLSSIHRKNKSMLNNQIKINPTVQNQHFNPSGQSSVNRQHINQYFDNYADPMDSNINPQQIQNAKLNNLNMTQNAQQLKGSNQNLGSASLKHNLSNSSHRKNKTSLIGNVPGQKLPVGANSISAFQPVKQGGQSNLFGNNQPTSASMKKMQGGRLSHSQRSLGSQSSQQRKRIQSIDSGQILKNNQNMGYQDIYSKQVSNASSGRITPDIQAQYIQGLKSGSGKQHSQKAQKILNDHVGMRQNLKPQGNIVISQQSIPMSQQKNKVSLNNPNVNSLKVHRKQSSILKGEHQNKQMILIGQQNNVTSNQNIQNNQVNMQNVQNINQGAVGARNSEDTVGSSNIGFVDGGTGGGSQKHLDKTRETSFQQSSNAQAEVSHKSSKFNTDKKANNKSTGVAESQSNQQSNQQTLQHETNPSSKMPPRRQMEEKQKVKVVNKGKPKLEDIDMVDIKMPESMNESLGQGLLQQSRDKGDTKGSQSSSQAVSQKQGSKLTKGERYKIQQDQLMLDFQIESSINIRKEALEIGKIPPEAVAQLVAASNYSLSHTDLQLSPRTREMVEVSQMIRKAFITKGDAPKTTPDFYRAGKMLGRGAFGKVSLGMHKLSRKLIALKAINKEFMSDEKQKSKVMHEVGILLRLRHNSVVKLYETFETKKAMLLVMELCAGGDLLNYVRKRKKLDEPVAKVIFKQIIEGLGYIHKKRVLHRDIKLDNILLDGNGNVKIADFGVSRLVKPSDVMHEQSGTPAYIAPEILKDGGYTGFKADIWSSGVVLYAMLFGTVPFKASDMKELHKMIIRGKYNLKEEISDDAKNLMRSMLETDPKKRISIQKILQHPWLQLPEDPCEIFNQEEKDLVKRDFIYNNPQYMNRSEKINEEIEPWDCFTELNLDSMNDVLKNESEKSQILAPFNSSLSDFDEEEYVGMEASLIIHRLYDDIAPLQDKKATLRFAARCRDQDRQYEINNNGDLDNGVYHKFVYSSKDGGVDPSSSARSNVSKLSANSLAPQSSRNHYKRSKSAEFKKEIDKRVKEGKQMETETSDPEYGEESTDTLQGIGLDGQGDVVDEDRIQTLIDFGYPEDYVHYCLLENEACYCLAGYYLLGADQNY